MPRTSRAGPCSLGLGPSWPPFATAKGNNLWFANKDREARSINHGECLLIMRAHYIFDEPIDIMHFFIEWIISPATEMLGCTSSSCALMMIELPFILVHCGVMAWVHFLLSLRLRSSEIQFALIVCWIILCQDITYDRIQIELEGMLCMQLTEHGM